MSSGVYLHLLPGELMSNGRAVQARRSLSCSLCRQQHGACIQCGNKGCFTAFHPLCARAASLVMESQHDELFSDSDDSPVKHIGCGTVDLTASCTDQPVAALQKKKRGPGRPIRVEGTAIGDGTRLVRHLWVEILATGIASSCRTRSSRP